MEDLNLLIKKVEKISQEYAEISQKSGENFNVFSIINMEWNEVKTHSSFIAELLNPKGSHGKGSVFLEFFFEELTKENFDYFSLNLDNVIVLKEEFIGRKNEDETQGGNIDIVIKDYKNQIVIENKIEASDQYNQLLRYKNHYPKSTLLYLTLFRNNPTDESIGNLEINKDFYCVSYERLIKNWLESLGEKK